MSSLGSTAPRFRSFSCEQTSRMAFPSEHIRRRRENVDVRKEPSTMTRRGRLCWACSSMVRAWHS